VDVSNQQIPIPPAAAQQLLKYEPFFKHDFLEWLDGKDNWHVYVAFEAHAQQLIDAGWTHYSARTIVELLVHHSDVRQTEPTFKISNARAPDLARVFSVMHPQYKNFWQYNRPDHAAFLKALP
jgi:hypothetical protein